MTPATNTMPKGLTVNLVATGIYSDKTSAIITDSVTWISVDTAIATVTTEGLASGVEVGNTTVTASKDSIDSNTATIEVTPAVLESIQVTPATNTMTKGLTVNLTATGTYSDKTKEDITGSVTWMSFDTATVTVTTEGLAAGVATGVQFGKTTITASNGSVTSEPVNIEVTRLPFCHQYPGVTSLNCMPYVELESGKRYTASPSQEYMDSTYPEVTYDDLYTESGLWGNLGNYVRFTPNNAAGWCTKLGETGFGGRTNWVLANRDDLLNLLSDQGSMYNAQGWAIYYLFWTRDHYSGDRWYSVNMDNGAVNHQSKITNFYASCVSLP